ncbi:helix-turn-helix transcriptional regulator [Lactiplantibacillus plantarum]|uniref:helix-turn-helix transcriptional regulator n=1 Tax=Lactiplantibacillus plantarum TaxID=1590 RepID=UPI0007E40297|nr:helix-turn-helix transcriptional regulator [Lactiplantibacillus plantarum]ANJ15369.1 transcriptional regulator [Lactiplantibacillus plantarum]MCB7178380.1 helix-turn-helix transcriptional regulator [Lactiplantibacillus plantarum]
MACGNWRVEVVLKNIILENHLKVARAEKSLNQLQLAKLVGVSRQTISNIETGEFVLSAKLALFLCLALDKKFEALFYFKEE